MGCEDLVGDRSCLLSVDVFGGESWFSNTQPLSRRDKLECLVGYNNNIWTILE